MYAVQGDILIMRKENGNGLTRAAGLRILSALVSFYQFFRRYRKGEQLWAERTGVRKNAISVHSDLIRKNISVRVPIMVTAETQNLGKAIETP